MSILTHTYKRIRRLARELAKFGSVGAMAFVVTFGFFNLFRHLDIGPLTSNGLATVIAATFSYFANRFWTFRNRDGGGNMGREFVVFFILNAIGLAITAIFLWFTHYVVGLRGGIAENVALVVGTGVATVFRYYAYKRWVFQAPKKTPAPAARPEIPVPVPGPRDPVPANGRVLRHPSGRPHLRQARARVVRAETVPLSELFR